MEDAKIKELRLIHKELATYLKRQDKAINNALQTVVALRRTLESDPNLRKLYKTNLRAAKDEIGPMSHDDANTLRTLLKGLSDW